MRTVIKNLLVVVTFLVLFSCKNSKNKSNSYPIIDYDSEIIYYKLDICNEDKYHQTQCGDWKETIKVAKTVIAGDSIFAYKDITNAVPYIQKNNLESNCNIRITISIKTVDGEFEDVWIWNQFLYVAGGFGERWGRVEISKLKFGEFQQGIKIIYREGNFDVNILNYKYKDNYWKLISRESLKIEPEIEMFEYCIDTINKGCHNKNKTIYLTNPYIFDMYNKKCIKATSLE